MRILGYCLLATVCGTAAAQSRKPVTDEEVRKVHQSMILIDTHNDVAMKTVRGMDFGQRATRGQTDLPRMKEGGVGGLFFAIFVSPSCVEKQQCVQRAIDMIDSVRYDVVGRYPNDFMLALTADDVEAAHRQGKIAALMGIEGGHSIQDDLRVLRTFYQLGARYMTLTHANTNNWADSSGDLNNDKVQHHNGLTDFGKQVVAEMNRLGMLVDVSHVSDKTFWDALEASKAPIFASHSSCRALCDVPRDMTDEMIEALAKKGGLININFAPSFLTARKDPPASVEDVVAHIDHVVKLAGIDAVGIGSDFDGIDSVPVGLEDNSKYMNLTRALLEKGYTAGQIRKIYGGNMLRLMRQAEETARKLQAGR
jgi:membrane dipeptidase